MRTRWAALPWNADGPGPPYRFGPGDPATAWPRLWTIGDRTLLEQRFLGFFCSRRCPGDVILRTYDLARDLRDHGVPVIGGFHSPMEQECLRLLLRGKQPVVVCPARGIERMRLPKEWSDPIEAGRLLVLSPFPAEQSRMTADLAAKRNRLVADLATAVFIAHASPAGRTAGLAGEVLAAGKPVWTFECPANAVFGTDGLRPLVSAAEVREALAVDSR